MYPIHPEKAVSRIDGWIGWMFSSSAVKSGKFPIWELATSATRTVIKAVFLCLKSSLVQSVKIYTAGITEIIIR